MWRGRARREVWGSPFAFGELWAPRSKFSSPNHPGASRTHSLRTFPAHWLGLEMGIRIMQFLYRIRRKDERWPSPLSDTGADDSHWFLSFIFRPCLLFLFISSWLISPGGLSRCLHSYNDSTSLFHTLHSQRLSCHT